MDRIQQIVAWISEQGIEASLCPLTIPDEDLLVGLDMLETSVKQALN